MLPRVIFTCVLVTLAACAYQPVSPLVLGEHAAAHKTATAIQAPTLRLVSFNIAHGRRDSFSQIFLGGGTIRDNLLDVARYLDDTEAHIVALQEADGPSPWSGNFDHVDFIAERGDFRHYVRAEHVKRWWGDYGTGVLSRYPFQDVYGHNFRPSPPTTRKGFTLASLLWQPNAGIPAVTVDVVSLHLDFSRESVRRSQIQELAQVLMARTNPLIVMGDFNSEHIASVYLPQLFESSSLLNTYSNPDKNLISFGNKRLDWILLSDELEFVDYYVDDVELSDHRPVIVDVKIKTVKSNNIYALQ